MVEVAESDAKAFPFDGRDATRSTHVREFSGAITSEQVIRDGLKFVWVAVCPAPWLLHTAKFAACSEVPV